MEPVDLEHHEIRTSSGLPAGLQLASRQRQIHRSMRPPDFEVASARCRTGSYRRVFIVRRGATRGHTCGSETLITIRFIAQAPRVRVPQQLPTRQAHLPTREVPHPEGAAPSLCRRGRRSRLGRAPSMALCARASVRGANRASLPRPPTSSRSKTRGPPKGRSDRRSSRRSSKASWAIDGKSRQDGSEGFRSLRVVLVMASFSLMESALPEP